MKDTQTELLQHWEQSKAVGMVREQWIRFTAAAYLPIPKAQHFHAAANLCDYEDGPSSVGYGGTRGQGKSHAAFAQAVIDDMSCIPGLKALYVRQLKLRSQESVQDLMRMVLNQDFFPYEYKNHTLTLPNGSFMLIAGFRSENDIDGWLGQQYDLIVIEDATSLSEAKRTVITGALRTNKQDWRPRIYESANPGGTGHVWFKKLYWDPWKRHSETIARFVHAVRGDNKMVNKEYDTWLNGLQGWYKRAWAEGDFELKAGQFFDNWDENRHVIDELELRKDWTYTIAMDPGHTHWNIIHLLAQDNDGTAYLVDEYAQRRAQVYEHVDGIDAMLARNNMARARVRNWVAGHDLWNKTQDNGSSLADKYAALGIQWRRAKNDRIQGAAEMYSRLGNDKMLPTFYVLRRCEMFINCIPDLVHDDHLGRSADVQKVDCNPDTGEGGDDAYDCARYGLMEQTTKKIEVVRYGLMDQQERAWMRRLQYAR